MVVRTTAASPKKRTKSPEETRIDESAKVHTFSNLSGAIEIGARVVIAPGTSIRADEGTPFHIGDDSKIQDGAIIHGLEKSRVVGDDGREYSVWIGRGSCMTPASYTHRRAHETVPDIVCPLPLEKQKDSSYVSPLDQCNDPTVLIDITCSM